MQDMIEKNGTACCGAASSDDVGKRADNLWQIGISESFFRIQIP
jgi:hypothetical protein